MMSDTSQTHTDSAPTTEVHGPSLLQRLRLTAARHKKLIVFLVVLSLFVTWNSWRIVQRYRLINEITVQGGSILYARHDMYHLNRFIPSPIAVSIHPIASISLPVLNTGEESDTDRLNPILGKLHLIPEAHQICFSPGIIRRRDISSLKNKPRLVYLTFSQNIFSSGCIEEIVKTCPQLESLSLSDCKMENQSETIDQSLTHIAKLSHLEVLNLDETGVTDAGIPKLSSAQSLIILSVANTQVSELALEELSYSLPRLRVFDD